MKQDGDENPNCFLAAGKLHCFGHKVLPLILQFHITPYIVRQKAAVSFLPIRDSGTADHGSIVDLLNILVSALNVFPTLSYVIERVTARE